ncbi:MAG: LamG-like jellyroll fold domain-containing protein [Saprospiraceae bacterium]
MKPHLFLCLLAFLVSTASSAQDITSDLLLSISFENELVNAGNSGTTLSSSQTLQYQEGPSAIAGKALDVSTGGTSIATGYAEDISTRTAACWLKSTDILGAGRNGAGQNVAFAQDNASLNAGLLAMSTANSVVTCMPHGNNGIRIPAVLDTWQHFTLSHGNNTVKTYLNGGLILQDTSNEYGSTVAPNSELLIASGRRGTEQFFKGAIDEFKFYQRELTPCDVATLYFSTAPDTSGSHLASYKLNGNALESSRRAQSGIMNGTIPTTDRFGYAQKAIQFNGSSDFIKLPITVDEKSRTVSLWVRPSQSSLQLTGLIQTFMTQDDVALEHGILRGDFFNGKMRLLAGGTTSMAEIEVDADVWYHVALVLDQTISRYYLNGELVSVQEKDDDASSIDPNPAIILGSGRSAGNQFFRGDLDDVKIYDRALTDCEISELSSFVSSNETTVESEGIRIFPNPASNSVTVTVDSDTKADQYRVLSISGKTILAGKFSEQISLSSLPTGLYILQIESESQVWFNKIIKS